MVGGVCNVGATPGPVGQVIGKRHHYVDSGITRPLVTEPLFADDGTGWVEHMKHVVVGPSAVPIHGGNADRLMRKPFEVGGGEQLTVSDHPASGLTTGDRAESQGPSGMEDVVLVLDRLIEVALTREDGVYSEAVPARVARFSDPNGMGEQLSTIKPGVATTGERSSKFEMTFARPKPGLNLVEIFDRRNELVRPGFEVIDDLE